MGTALFVALYAFIASLTAAKLTMIAVFAVVRHDGPASPLAAALLTASRT
jgi:hypothetical protein